MASSCSQSISLRTTPMICPPWVLTKEMGMSDDLHPRAQRMSGRKITEGKHQDS